MATPTPTTTVIDILPTTPTEPNSLSLPKPHFKNSKDSLEHIRKTNQNIKIMKEDVMALIDVMEKPSYLTQAAKAWGQQSGWTRISYGIAIGLSLTTFGLLFNVGLLLTFSAMVIIGGAILLLEDHYLNAEASKESLKNGVAHLTELLGVMMETLGEVCVQLSQEIEEFKKENEKYKAENQTFKEENSKFKLENDKFKENVDGLEKNVNELEQLKGSLTMKVNELTTTVASTLEQHKEQVNQLQQQFQNKMSVLEQQYKTELELTGKKSRDELESLAKKHTDELTKAKNALQSKIGELDNTITQLKEQVTVLEGHKATLRKFMIDFTDEHKLQGKALQDKVDAFLNDKAAMYKEISTKISEHHKKLEETTAELSQEREKLADVSKKLEETHRHSKEVAEQNSHLTEKLQNLVQQLEELKKQPSNSTVNVSASHAKNPNVMFRIAPVPSANEDEHSTLEREGQLTFK